jgi:hypothetical protein
MSHLWYGLTLMFPGWYFQDDMSTDERWELKSTNIIVLNSITLSH